MNSPIFASKQDLCNINHPDGLPGVMHGLDSIGDLHYIRPDRAFGDGVGLCLEPAVLECGCLGLEVGVKECLGVWVVSVRYNQGWRDEEGD